MKPKHYKPQYAVAQTVADMQRKFVYPDVDTKPGPPFIGGGGGAPTVVVAAADASDISKGKADILATGVDDDQAIQAALNIADRSFASGTGGRVLLTEGVFNCRYNEITMSFNTINAPSHLQGMGRSTVLNFSGIGSGLGGTMAGIDINAAGCLVSDLLMIGNNVSGVKGIEIGSDGGRSVVRNVVLDDFGGGTDAVINIFLADEIHITGCRLLNSQARGIALSASNNSLIRDNHIDVTGAGVFGTGVDLMIVNNQFIGPGSFAVDNDGDSDWLIQGNIFIDTSGVRCGTAADNIAILDNFFDSDGQVLFTAAVSGCKVSGNIWSPFASGPTIDGAIVFDAGATDCQITDNLIQDAGGMDAIRVETGLDVLIANNLIGEGATNGIVVNSGTRVHVEGNTVKFAGEHGIDYDGNDGSVVDNLVFGSSQNLTNTSDNINLSGNANLCQGNHSLPALIAPLTRYGINIVSGNDNAVYANALGDSSVYGTADSVNSGTGTQVTPAAGVIGGQFAY